MPPSLWPKSSEGHIEENAYGVDELYRRPAPLVEAAAFPYAILAIPDGQTIATASLDVITDYARSAVGGTAMSVNATTGLITFNEEGIYDIHTWAEMDNQGAYDLIEGPVFQGGQDFQDIGNGLRTHRQNTNYVHVQHMTRIWVADLPQSVNLQVRHERGSNDFLVNGGISIVQLVSLA